MRTSVEQRHLHDEVDPHVRGRWLSDLVLGAQDGLVNTLGVALGVAAASGSARLTFAAGLAAGVAEAISMAAVGYTSSMARGDLYRAERAREYRHLEAAPEVERDEIRQLYANKGFRGPLLERVVDTLCADRDVWVAVMMSEEHRLCPVDRRASLRAAAVIGGASLLGALIPVLPFAILGSTLAVGASLALGTAALFALGAFKAKVTTLAPGRGGAVLAAIGLASAAAGYAIGALLATG